MGDVVDEIPTPSCIGDAGFEHALVDAFTRLPDAAGPDERLDLAVRHGEHVLSAKMIYRPGRRDGVWASPGMNPNVDGRLDDSGLRIRQAVTNRRKLRQAGGASRPVLLALSGGMFTDSDDFDVELLGQTTEVVDLHGAWNIPMSAGREFTPSGVLSDPGNPWDGVLVLPRVGVFDADEPVLYISPRFDHRLPSAFMGLEHRTAGQDGVEIHAATGDVMTKLGFPPAR